MNFGKLFKYFSELFIIRVILNNQNFKLVNFKFIEN